MISDDERREVASKLRAYLDTPAPWNLGNAVSNALGECGDYDNIELLADLIEPITSVNSTVECDGFNYTFKMQYVDRDALLSLVEELEHVALEGGNNGDELVMSRGAAFHYSRRIREALGVGDGQGR